jgi:hypothetical protein
MCPIQLETDLIVLDFPDGIFQRKIVKQWRQNVSFFQPILNRKLSDKNLPTQTLL